MPARGLWPLLAYAALGAVALALPGAEKRSAQRRSGSSRNREAGASGVMGRPGERPAGRGRTADAPWRIPWRGWKDILWRLYGRIDDNRLLAVAAGVVFYGVLALFPALAAFVSLYGMIADASTVNAHVSTLSGILPGGAVQILQESLQRLTAKSATGLSAGFVFGLAFALWSANSGVKAIFDALNVAYQEKEKRSFLRLNLLSLAFTMAAMVALIVAVAVIVAAPVLLARLGLGAVSDTLIGILRWPALLILVVLGLAALYRYGPSRREPRWRWISVGSATAAVAWLLGSALFSWYIANFGTYNVTYGSLGAAIGMMMWMWLSMIVILAGAELNAEIERQTGRDSTVGGEKPRGQRGSAMADTLGPATG